MNREQIKDLLSDVIQELDYDLWKDIFPGQGYESSLEIAIEQVQYHLRAAGIRVTE